ncbi:MAG: TonB-dependent receptor [Desulfocapsa sp.]|nr:TonB-dependent receptor [Desulfocapsa sp.]
MRKIIRSGIALALLGSASLAVAAEERTKDNKATTLEEVVVTATRSAEGIKNVPAKVELINRQTIEETVAYTLTEQLKKNSSIGVIEYPGALAGIGIRGFRPEFSGITKHSLVLINGRPAGATNLATILSDNIERIEVLKGPASSLYGGEAMGGVVNIITRKNTEELTGMAEAGFGSFETNFQKASLGGGLGDRFDFDISARRFDQADDFKMGNGETRSNTSYQTQNANLRLGANLGENWRLDTSADIYQGRDIETPGDTFAGDDKSGHKDIDRYGLDFTVTGEIGEKNQLSFTVYKTNETQETYRHYTGWFTTTQVAPYQSYDSDIDWLGLQIKNEYRWNQHSIITGIDYQDINKESRSYNLDSSRKAPWSPDESRENWGGYLETVWRFMDKRLTATAGGRYDAFDVETLSTPYKTDFTPNSETFSTFSPRAGLNYRFEQGIRLHSTIGQAFVPPNAGQLAGYSETNVGGTTMITRGNANLDPETSLSYDLGVGYDKQNWGLSLDLTYFHTDVDDKISWATRGNITTYENSLSAEMEGLETMLSFDIGAPLNWDRSLSLFVNSTHMFKAEEEQTDGTMKDIHNVAKYTVNYGVQYDDGAFNGKLHVRNQGRMKDTDWNAAGYPEVEYPSFTVVDLMVGYTFLDHHRVIFKADNIFDKDYYEKKGFPKPGQSFFVSYRYSF